MPGPAPVTVATQWAVELETAVQAALGAWLASGPAGLGAIVPTNQPAVQVFSDWPEPDLPLIMPRVTVLRAGPPDVEDLDPVVVGTPAPVAGNIFTYTWLVGYATLPLQLDVWADSSAQRGDVLARLHAALTAGVDVTLAGYIAAQAALTPPNVLPMHDPVANEILLELAAPWAGTIAVYYFEKPRLSEIANTTGGLASPGGEREWRATLDGTASYGITRKANSPAIASLVVSAQGTTDAAGASNAGPPWITTITPGGITHTR